MLALEYVGQYFVTSYFTYTLPLPCGWVAIRINWMHGCKCVLRSYTPQGKVSKGVMSHLSVIQAVEVIRLCSAQLHGATYVVSTKYPTRENCKVSFRSYAIDDCEHAACTVFSVLSGELCTMSWLMFRCATVERTSVFLGSVSLCTRRPYSSHCSISLSS